MPDERSTKLQRLGLSSAEAEIYLALLRNGGTLGATALADAMGVQRTTVYPILTSLTQKGMVEAGAGYGSRFTAVRPDEALPFLIAREREELSRRERLAEENLLQRKHLAGELAKQLESLGNSGQNNGEAEVIQVLRDPRIVAERFERLELEAERQVEIFVKAPIFIRGSEPAHEKALRRGVRIRCLYERAVLDDPAVKPYLAAWIAGGEQARMYDGELPHKLAMFDRQKILMPLLTPGGKGTTLFIRHPQLATSLGMFFETLWERAEPVAPGNRRTAKIASARTQLKSKSKKRASAGVAPSGNHGRNDKSPSSRQSTINQH